MQAAGISVPQVVQALEAAEPGGAGRAAQRPAGRAGHPAQGSARHAGRTSTAWSWRSGTAGSSAWARSRRVRDGTEEQRDQALVQRPRRGRHRDPQGQGLQHDPGHRRDPPPRRRAAEAHAAGRQAGDRAGRRPPGASRGAERAGGADRGRAAHRAGGVPLPQLLALDGHHRSRAAGERAGVVHRGVGLRLHAEHDVADGTLARDRHPDRRRHRGAGEHRPPHRDGEGSLHRPRARAPTRSGSR